MPNKNYSVLKDKWIKKHKNLQQTIADKHKDSFKWLSENSKQLAVGSLGSLILLASPLARPALPESAIRVAGEQAQKVNKNIFLISDLAQVLPQEVRPLTTEEENKVGEILSRTFGMKVSASVGENRLNRTYGLMGAEQHLARYPGDTMSSHFDDPADAQKYFSSGMAPGLGAWGHFTTSASQMTPEDSEREKYYIAVQTFLSPNFGSKVAEYRDFYRFRKMLAVNPQNGKAMIVVIGDAGPAEWTGKHLGGSPEVMSYLERQDGRARGPVLYYFLDDSDNQIPLGPVKELE